MEKKTNKPKGKLLGRRRAEKPTPASEQEYLASDLEHWIDSAGEPTGLESTQGRKDPAFQEFTLSLWREIQATRSLTAQMKEAEKEGLTAGDLWMPGISEAFPTSSTAEEVRRYKQKLLFRANILEAVLTETVTDLKRLDRLKPNDDDVTK